MSYKKAVQILPDELLEMIQEYVDGEFIYIPKKEGNKKEWGSNTTTRKELEERDIKIYEDYISGQKLLYLSEKYFLSLKSIQRIIHNQKNNN
ncbi:MAG: CD3324 family protein [Bacillota bacterium]|nr:CD3324 family protein [Bacillota bacterium]